MEVNIKNYLKKGNSKLYNDINESDDITTILEKVACNHKCYEYNNKIDNFILCMLKHFQIDLSVFIDNHYYLLGKYLKYKLTKCILYLCKDNQYKNINWNTNSFNYENISLFMLLCDNIQSSVNCEKLIKNIIDYDISVLYVTNINYDYSLLHCFKKEIYNYLEKNDVNKHIIKYIFHKMIENNIVIPYWGLKTSYTNFVYNIVIYKYFDILYYLIEENKIDIYFSHFTLDDQLYYDIITILIQFDIYDRNKYENVALDLLKKNPKFLENKERRELYIKKCNQYHCYRLLEYITGIIVDVQEKKLRFKEKMKEIKEIVQMKQNDINAL